MVVKRNLSAIRIAVTASEIARPEATRAQQDGRIMERFFSRLREVVLHCRSKEASLDKVAGDLVALLSEYGALEGIEIHPQEQRQHVGLEDATRDNAPVNAQEIPPKVAPEFAPVDAPVVDVPEVEAPVNVQANDGAADAVGPEIRRVRELNLDDLGSFKNYSCLF